MTDIEMDILDELYFVTSFQALGNTLALEHLSLRQHLQGLVARGWVKCFFPDPDTEVDFDPELFLKQCHNYFFLATKAGLLAHNSR